MNWWRGEAPAAPPDRASFGRLIVALDGPALRVLAHTLRAVATVADERAGLLAEWEARSDTVARHMAALERLPELVAADIDAHGGDCRQARIAGGGA